MNDEVILSDTSAEVVPTSAHPWEPWRCTACDKFVYNVDEKGYPIEGAPCPRYVSKDYPIVCSVCWTLYTTVDRSEYFTKIAREAKEAIADKFRYNRRLGPGGNYMI